MAAEPSIAVRDSLESLTAAERQRVGALLASVSTQTLLHSLARLCNDNADTKLIISALLGRGPFEETPPAD